MASLVLTPGFTSRRIVHGISLRRLMTTTGRQITATTVRTAFVTESLTINGKSGTWPATGTPTSTRTEPIEHCVESVAWVLCTPTKKVVYRMEMWLRTLHSLGLLVVAAFAMLVLLAVATGCAVGAPASTPTDACGVSVSSAEVRTLVASTPAAAREWNIREQPGSADTVQSQKT